MLGRELRLARQAEAEDGQRRVFVLGAEEVAREVPAYGKFVAEQVRRLGRQHPLVRTQFYSEEIDAVSGLFPAASLALMLGDHPSLDAPRPGEIYAMLVDVGGQSSKAQAAWQQVEQGLSIDMDAQDLTAATVVQVDIGTINDQPLQAPTYRVIRRQVWQGMPHSHLYGALRAIAEHWQVQRLVIDATGLGAGLASFVERLLGQARVERFVFTQKSKSDLGWGFLAIVESGRFKDYRIEQKDTEISLELTNQDSLKRLFQLQVQYCQAEFLPGPGRLMRWSVPDNRRDPSTGRLIHDDLLVSAAFCAVLDRLSWGTAESAVLPGPNILAGLAEAF